MSNLIWQDCFQKKCTLIIDLVTNDYFLINKNPL